MTVFSTHNRDAKVAEIPKTAARISQPSAGCPEVRFRKICPRVAPVCDRKFFFSPPCLRAVFGIGCVGIAVLNGSGSLELRCRRVKSANKLWICRSISCRFCNRSRRSFGHGVRMVGPVAGCTIKTVSASQFRVSNTQEMSPCCMTKGRMFWKSCS